MSALETQKKARGSVASTKKGAAVPALEDVADESAQADALAATEAARVQAEADAVAAEEAARVQAEADAAAKAAGDAIVTFTFEEARVRSLAILRAISAGDAPTTEVGELDGLMAALEAAAPPPPVHEETCQTFAHAKARAAMAEKGMSEELIETFATYIPSACNCKASKPKRASSTSGASRGTPTRTVPIGTAPVQYTKLDGTTVGMKYSEAARQAASDYPAAKRCVKYVKDNDAGMSLNAQVPLRKDAEEGLIPAIAIRFAADPVVEAEAEAKVEQQAEANAEANAEAATPVG